MSTLASASLIDAPPIEYATWIEDAFASTVAPFIVVSSPASSEICSICDERSKVAAWNLNFFAMELYAKNINLFAKVGATIKGKKLWSICFSRLELKECKHLSKKGMITDYS